MDNKYVIISIKNNRFERYDNLLFWGKNSRGYTMDIRKAGIYSLEDAIKIANKDNVYVNIDFLEIDDTLLEIENLNIEICIPKIEKICNYIDDFIYEKKYLQEI